MPNTNFQEDDSRITDLECGLYDEEDLGHDEPHESHDLSDDGDALASAGWGTDEDYGDYGDDPFDGFEF